jgi:hypothetical protein
MATTLKVRRDQALTHIADNILAEEDLVEQSLADALQAKKEAKVRAAEMLAQARKGEETYCEGAHRFQEGVKLAMAGLTAMLQASTAILLLPGTAAVVSKAGILTRCSRWLASQLFAAARNGDHFGAMRLHYTGRPSPIESFVDAERFLVGQIFVVQDEMEKQDGIFDKGNGSY